MKLLTAATRPWTDYKTARAGTIAARTDTYDPDAYLRESMPRLERWDPENNPVHKHIKLTMELETETSVTTASTTSTMRHIERGSPRVTQTLFGLCFGTELLSGVAVAHEYGLEGFVAVLSGILLGSSIFFLMKEICS